MLVSGLAVVLTLGLMTFQNFVVRRTGSLAISADRAHYATDFVTNIAVGIGIFLSSRLRPADDRHRVARAVCDLPGGQRLVDRPDVASTC